MRWRRDFERFRGFSRKWYRPCHHVHLSVFLAHISTWMKQWKTFQIDAYFPYYIKSWIPAAVSLWCQLECRIRSPWWWQQVSPSLDWLIVSFLDCAGLGIIFGLFISPITRTENFQPLRVHNIIHRAVEAVVSGPEKVKVLCWVMTGPTNHQAKVRQSLIFPVCSLHFLGPTREGDLGVSV